MTRIWERLFVGCLADAQRLSRKNPDRIATVISVCEQCIEDKAAEVRYIHLPVEDDESVPIHQFDAVMQAILVSVSTGNVLLNCGLGISRAPSLAAGYLHRVGYKHFDAALEEIEQLRPIINPSKILVRSIKEILQ
jgi:protein-tyrosine phosphatase